MEPDANDIKTTAERQLALLKGLQADESWALLGIMNEFHAALLTFGIGLLGNEQDANVVVNETFRKMHERRAAFKEFGALKAFLYVTNRNHAYDLLRLRKYERETSYSPSAIEALADPGEADFNAKAESQAIRAELLNSVYQQIPKLAPRQQDVIEMVLEGKKNPEIANHLGLEVHVVKQLKSRAITNLRKSILRISLHFLP